ncbi:MAG: histidine triad nucleotide-binding protein [Candidatus Nanopelagicales bacterium]
MTHDPDCLFCAIAVGEIPGDIVFSDDTFLAFRDVNPQAPVHVLVIPRDHYADAAALAAADPAVAGGLLEAATQVARSQELAAGYRIVLNTGSDGGQTVGHVHAHVLGGRQMQWPPG